MGPSFRAHQHLFSPGSRPETSRIADVLRRESVGGTLLVAAAVVALVWANSPLSDSYAAVRDTAIGPAGLHLNLTVGQWAADGLLAVFFFVAGLELKREFVAGDLRDPRHAALPIAAAVAGMIVPALLYLMVNWGADATALRGWGIPIATDIAFALAVLAVIGRHLPPASAETSAALAVVDDLLAIIVIAVFFTRDLQPVLLLLATLPLVAFGVLVQRRVRSWWLLLPLAVATWTLVHASGVHATVAGVLLAFTVPVLGRRGRSGAEAGPGLAEHFDFRWRPLSAGVAVPVFALWSAGVTVGGLSGLGQAFRSSVTVGIVVGLVVGKALGVMAGAYLVARLTRATPQ